MSVPLNEVTPQPRGWWMAALIDIQFWVPFVVLIVGLVLLSLVQ